MASKPLYLRKIQPIPTKRYNVVLHALDYQTLQGFHMEFPEKYTDKSIVSNFRRSNSPMFPFGVKAKRFKWQTQSEVDGNDLTGQMKDYTYHTINHSASWKDLMNKRPFLSPRRSIGYTKAFNNSIAGEINTRRTLTPTNDLLSSHYDLGKERKANVLKRNKTSGSFQYLMNKTAKQKNIKIRLGVSKESGVFTKEYNTVNLIVNHKSFVNLKSEKILKGSAGNIRPRNLPKNYFDNDNTQTNTSRNVLKQSYSRTIKINSYCSDIFNRNKKFSQTGRINQTYEFTESLMQ